MKKLAALIVGLFAFVAVSQAQIELSPFAGFTFGDKFYAGRMGEGFSYGGSLAYRIHRFAAIDFTYLGQNGTAKVYGNNENKRFDLASSYYLLGLTKNLPIAHNLETFGGFGAGLAVYSPDLREYDTMVRFGVGLKAGLKFWFSDRVGLFVQASANFPITDVDANVWWTYGGGVDSGMSTSVPFTQFGFAGGLTFKIGKAQGAVE
ncbi:MAG: hypothetical protein ACK5LR_10635 [Mangrovibacterium sp.]